MKHKGHRKPKGEFNPVKRPGAATRKAHAKGESVQEWAKENYHAKGLKGKQARFAEIVRHWKHKGRKKRSLR